MDKQVFINSIKEGALRGQAHYGILPSLTIGQEILESNLCYTDKMKEPL